MIHQQKLRSSPWLLALLFVVHLVSAVAEDKWTPLEYAPDNNGLLENPLKGLLPWAGRPVNDFPHSMEWFYLKLNEVMKGPAQFDWYTFDAKLNAISSSGNQAIFRFFVDYPNQTSGIPQFLLAAGLKTFYYTDSSNTVSVAPDYSDPRLIAAFTNFVTALGARYDGDPRIGFVEVGLYGFWGEWHVHQHPTAGEPAGWRISQQSKDAILKAYLQAFQKTLVMVRYPVATPDPQLQKSFGYHDDSIAKDTIGEKKNYFWRQIIDDHLESIWQRRPIGGEMYPALGKTVWNLYPRTEDQNLAECIKETHMTWICNSAAFAKSLTAEQREKALQAHRLLGYELFASAVQMNRTLDGGLTVSVQMENRGLAPFYYDWGIELGVVDKDQHLLTRVKTSWRLTGVLPGKIAQWTTTLPALPAGSAAVVLHVVNPLANGKPLCFANASQDKNLPGWLTLGDVPDK